MTAQLIDLAATADIRRARLATGQSLQDMQPVRIRAKIGDNVFDPVSQRAGFFTRFTCVNGHQYAVIASCGCAVAAKLPDLVPLPSQPQ
jgi:hypothetical protein